MKIVVIIPTYNEKENIERMIPVLEKEIFPKITKHDMSILVADDTSPDGTGKVVEKFIKEYKNVQLLQGKKEGLGVAYARAMRFAMDQMQADAVIEFDADFQHDPHDIPHLIAAMDEGADYVIGSRYVKGGGIPKEWGFERKLLSRVGGLIARIIWLNFSIHDMTSGFKLTKSEYLRKVDLEHLYSKTFAYKLHILHDVVKLGAKVKEVPIIFYEREAGQSKINKKESFESLYVVFRLRLDDSKRLVKFLIVGGVGFVINAIVLFVLSDQYHWPHSLANLLGAAFAIFSNFNFNNIWTFKEQKAHGIVSYFRKLIKFYASSAFGVIVIQTGTIYLGDHFISFTYYKIYFLIGTFFLLIWNFTLYSKFVWRNKKSPS